MGLKCGIVGLPNVGKSTLFNALTNAQIAASNYPFCTIEPNKGMVLVPDPRLTALSAIVKPQKIQPTTMEIVDIAGLVKGASKGEGLGNQFLANIREMDAIIHVVRCFAHDDVVHVEGKIDPLHDMSIIDTELALADLETVEKALMKATKNSRSGSKEGIFEKQCLDKIKAHLDAGNPVRSLQLSADEQDILRPLFLLTAKPILYLANINDEGYANNPLLDIVTKKACEENAHLIALSAATEAELVSLDAADRKEFMEALQLSEPGLDRVIRAAFGLLGLQTYFTAGVKEVRAWTIPVHTTAPQAASVIHTDFEKGFIRAEVIAYADFITYQGEQGAKEAGKLRVEGKDYIVCDGDVMHFRFNV